MKKIRKKVKLINLKCANANCQVVSANTLAIRVTFDHKSYMLLHHFSQEFFHCCGCLELKNYVRFYGTCE